MSFFLILLSSFSWAKTPKEILEEAIAKQQIENSIQTLTMTLFAKNGSIQERKMEIHVRKDEDAVRSYTRFSSPPEIAGTQLLLVDHPNQDDPQLLYLPALKRVQRIAGGQKDGAFLGSDFLFSDLELSLDGKETHSITEENEEEWVIQSSNPQNKQYKYWVTTISKKDLLPYRISYYAKNGSHIKTFSIEKTMTVDGRIIPAITVMSNHLKGTKTKLEINSIAINLSEDKLPLERFLPQNLKTDD